MERFVSLIVSFAGSFAFYLLLYFEIKANLKLGYYIKEHQWLQPNWICVWRTILCLTGILVYFTSQSGLSLFIGIFLYTFGSFLDAVDGLIAKECDLVTEFGKYLDPFCDKVAYLTPLFVFSYQGLYSHKLVWILIMAEFMGQFFAREWLRKSRRSVAANWIGKLKAVICFSFVIYCVLLDDGVGVPNFSNYLLAACIILSFGSSLRKLLQKGVQKTGR